MCLICDLSRIIVVAIKQRIDDRQGGIVRIRLIFICAGNENEKK
ncbi:membrane protein, partial [Escherichia coli O26:H11 str. 2010C-3871]